MHVRWVGGEAEVIANASSVYRSRADADPDRLLEAMFRLLRAESLH